MENVFKPERIRVSEGYGISEVGSIATNGIRCFECAVHIEDVPSMNYFVNTKPARGLLWVYTRRGAGMSRLGIVVLFVVCCLLFVVF